MRLQPPPGTATEADVVAVQTEKIACVNSDDVLVEKTMGYYESYIAATRSGFSVTLLWHTIMALSLAPMA